MLKVYLFFGGGRVHSLEYLQTLNSGRMIVGVRAKQIPKRFGLSLSRFWIPVASLSCRTQYEAKEPLLSKHECSCRMCFTVDSSERSSRMILSELQSPFALYSTTHRTP